VGNWLPLSDRRSSRRFPPPAIPPAFGCPADAEILEKEFAPEVKALDLVGLPNYQVYLNLMIDGKVSRPFSAETVAR
jgi:hypothetical protein